MESASLTISLRCSCASFGWSRSLRSGSFNRASWILQMPYSISSYRVQPPLKFVCAKSFDAMMPTSSERPYMKYEMLARAVRSEPLSTSDVEALLDTIKWGTNGLVVAIAQHIDTGAVLMQGFANRDAVAMTIKSHLATFYSRSRATLWTKGETSSNFINVLDVFLDCDRDSVIYLGAPDGPTCHTGAETCYFTSVTNILGGLESSSNSALTTLYSLENIIKQKKLEIEGENVTSSIKPSWTKTLLGNRDLLCSKIREEADELCRSLEEDEGRERTSSEFADVLYHAMVLLAVQDVNLEEVLKILRSRFSQSGIDEKQNRKSGP